MIYTEDKQPTKIKYLKTISKTDSDKYILRGNDQPNIFECKEDRECVMYGGVETDKETGDIFQFSSDSNNYTIKDFRKGQEADKITIPIADKDIIYPNEDVLIGSEPTLEITGFGYGKEVRIEGYTKSEIRGWVEIAKTNATLGNNYQSTDPIFIIK